MILVLWRIMNDRNALAGQDIQDHVPLLSCCDTVYPVCPRHGDRRTLYKHAVKGAEED